MNRVELLSGVLDCIPDPVMVIDAEYRIVAVNKAARSKVGDVDLDRERVLCHEVSQHRDTPCGVTTGSCPLDEVVTTGKVARRTHVHTSPNGEPLMAEMYTAPLADNEGTVTHVVEICRDRPNEHIDEAALKDSETRFRSLTESTSDWIWQVDVDGVYTYASPKSRDLLGYDPEEVVGKTAFDFMRPDEAERVQGLFKDFAKEKQSFERVENICLHKEGHEVVVETSAVPVLGPNGTLLGYRGIDRDLTDWKRAEEARRESEERFRKLVESAPMGIHTYDLDVDDRLIFRGANPAADAILGIDNSQFVGQYIEDAFPPLKNTDVPDRYRRAAALGEACEWEQIDYDHEGIRGAFEVHAFQTVPGSMACMFLDITERKRAAEEMQKLAEVVKRSSELVNLATLDGKMIFLNEAGSRMLGIDPHKVIETRILEVIPDHLKELVEKEVVARLLRGDVWEGELQYRNLKTGALTDVHTQAFTVKDAETGKPIFLANVSMDITERTKAEETQKRLLTAVEQTSDTIVITDVKGDIQYVNPAFEKVTGYSREEAIGQNPRLLSSGVHSPAFYQTLWRSLVEGREWSGHFTNRRKDGSLFEEEATISPIRDVAGTITNYVAVKRDVTHEVELEAQLLQAQKMESIGRLAGGVAHDFNNLLLPILGYSEILLQDFAPDDPRYDSLQQIQRAAQRAGVLTRQLLAFGRKQVLEMKKVDLGQVVLGFEKILRRTIREDIEVIIKGAASAGVVRADVAQIEQILMNLAVNSQDAMPRGGKLIVGVEDIWLDEAHAEAHPDAAPGPYVMLAVSDTGSGIENETLKQIFEPFFTTKDRGKGTGLGLSTVYGIVKQHGGDVWVYSESGIGTTFKIFLPRVEGAPDRDRDSLAEPHIKAGEETVMVVEDDDMVRGLVHSTLSKLGYSVIGARDADDCLKLLDSHNDAVDLLLTDVVMPGMNGRELAEQLCTRIPGLKVIYMSGYTDDVIGHHGVLEEGVEIIQKPMSVRVLAGKVREVLDR